MKSVVFIYAGSEGARCFDPIFSSQSAFDRVLIWAKTINDSSLVIAVTPQNHGNVRLALEKASLSAKILEEEKWNTQLLLEKMAKEGALCGTEPSCAVYARADEPFLDCELTQKLLHDHEHFLAEYTFADGWPLGFAPEVIDCGTLNLLASLSKDRFKEQGEAPVSPECIFNVIKGDINSFEIESVISPEDFRMLRLNFSCTKKENFIACQRLFETALDTRTAFTATELSRLASKTASIQQTVPAFYAVQITENMALPAIFSPYPKAFEKKYGKLPFAAQNASPRTMSLEAFSALVSQIADFSETAVVSLSAWGDPLCVKELPRYVEKVLSYPGLSVLLETDASLLTEETVQQTALAVKKSSPRLTDIEPVMWIVSLDAVSGEMYQKIHGEGAELSKVQGAVKILEAFFPGAVYPQFTRMNLNEDELESFYRYWHDTSSPSKGRVIIQKYDWFSGLLTQEKPADLSPLDRNPCWHLKRDMTVLCDGSVPFCREHILDCITGNVFNEGIKSVWSRMKSPLEDHIACKYENLCGKCDEYYTFNF